jgi:hypothetical protein
MGLPQSEFWEMTPREYGNACEGYSKKREEEFKVSWEQTRQIVTMLVNVNSPKRRFKPQDILKFPWDGKGGENNYEEDIKKLKEEREKKWREQERQ